MKFFVFLNVQGVRLLSYQRDNRAIEYLPFYDQMFRKSNSKVLLESLYSLFHLNYSDFLRNLNTESDIKIIFVNSNKESVMFFGQSDLMKELCPKAEYIVLNGDHNSFVLDAYLPEMKQFLNKMFND